MNTTIIYIPASLHARLRTHIIHHGLLLSSGFFGGVMTINNEPCPLILTLELTAIYTPTSILLPS